MRTTSNKCPHSRVSMVTFMVLCIAALMAWAAPPSRAATATVTLSASGESSYSDIGFFTLSFVSGTAGLSITEVELNARATGDVDGQFDPTPPYPGDQGRPPTFVAIENGGLTAADVVMRTWNYGDNEGDPLVWDVVSPFFLLTFGANAFVSGDSMGFDIDTDRVGPDSSHPEDPPNSGQYILDADDGDVFGDTQPVGMRVRFSNGEEVTGTFSNDGVDNDFSLATVAIPEARYLGLFGLLGLVLIRMRQWASAHRR